MTNVKELQSEIPCDTCVHHTVCNVRKCFEETKIDTTHPFVIVELRCSEYMNGERKR